MIQWSVFAQEGLITVIGKKGPIWVAARYPTYASDYEVKHWQQWAEQTINTISAKWSTECTMSYRKFGAMNLLCPERVLGHVVLDVGNLSMPALRVIVTRNGTTKEYIVGDLDGHVYIAVYPYLSDLRVCQTIAPR